MTEREAVDKATGEYIALKKIHPHWIKQEKAGAVEQYWITCNQIKILLVTVIGNQVSIDNILGETVIF